MNRTPTTETALATSWEKYLPLSLDSGLCRKNGSASFVIPGEASGRGPESRILLYTRIGRDSFRHCISISIGLP